MPSPPFSIRGFRRSLSSSFSNCNRHCHHSVIIIIHQLNQPSSVRLGIKVLLAGLGMLTSSVMTCCWWLSSSTANSQHQHHYPLNHHHDHSSCLKSSTDADSPWYALVPCCCWPQTYDHQLLWQVIMKLMNVMRVDEHMLQKTVSYIFYSTAWVETTVSAWKSWMTTCMRSTRPRQVYFSCFGWFWEKL